MSTHQAQSNNSSILFNLIEYNVIGNVKIKFPLLHLSIKYSFIKTR